jgi:HK97 family phage major capsid protein/HK97 family phage prohead protease
MSTQETRSFFRSQLRILPGEVPRIKGLIPYNSRSEDLGGWFEYIRPGSFRKTLESGSKVMSYWSHDPAMPLGSTSNGTLKLRDTDAGLECEISLDTSIDFHERAYKLIKNGTLEGLSFGFTLNENGDVWSENMTKRELTDIRLSEISPVSAPAYPASCVQARNHKPKTNKQDEERKMSTTRAKAFFSGDKRNYSPNDKFTCVRDFLFSVMENGDLRGKTLDPRLQRATGLGESGPASEGGFLLPSNLIDSLLFGDDASSLLNLCDRYTIKGGNSCTLPGVDEQSRVSGSQLGGMVSTWAPEAAAMSYVNPLLNALELQLGKLTTLCPISDELFDSGPVAERFIKNIVKRSFAYEIDRSIFRGLGGVGGQPLGVLNAPCTLTIDPAVGQSAGTISAENCREMVAHLPPESLGKDSLVVLINPQLMEIALTTSVGVGGSGAPLISYDNQGLPRIMGIKVYPWQHCSPPAERGSFLIGDFSQYVWMDRKIKQAFSIHVLFLQDEGVFKFTYRATGQPSWSRAITPANASSATRRMSPFVVLGATG